MGQSTIELSDQCLKCLASWVQLGVNIAETEHFISHVFRLLQEPQLFDTAIDTLINIFVHVENHRLLNLINGKN